MQPRDSKPTTDPGTQARHATNAAAHVSRNVATIAAAHHTAEDLVSRHQHFVERLTRRLGRPSSIYTTTATIGLWVCVNLALPVAGLPALDAPPFFWLQSATACSALIVALMVLTTQIRQAHQAEKRSGLDLQVNLLSEQKLAKLVALLEELRRDLPTVPNRYDPVARTMAEAMDMRTAMLALEDSSESQSPTTHEPTRSATPSTPGTDPLAK